MKWYVPGAFFALACVLNLVGCIDNDALAQAVKPTLLPLLAVTTLAFLLGKDGVDRKGATLLVTAQLLGCTGDVLLIPSRFWFFAGGMGAFLAGHVCYMCLFGGRSWKGISLHVWAGAVFVMIVLVRVLLWAIGAEGDLSGPMFVYGMGLMMLIFSGLAGVVKGGGTTWWIILCGALLFTFSDALIAMNTFGMALFEARHFVVMLTYLAAQSLRAVGGVRLILGRR